MLVSCVDDAIFDDSRQRQNVIVGRLPQQQIPMDNGEAKHRPGSLQPDVPVLLHPPSVLEDQMRTSELCQVGAGASGRRGYPAPEQAR